MGALKSSLESSLKTDASLANHELVTKCDQLSKELAVMKEGQKALML